MAANEATERRVQLPLCFRLQETGSECIMQCTCNNHLYMHVHVCTIFHDLSPSQTRTRSQLFLHLVEEIALTLDDPESSSLAKRYVRLGVHMYRYTTDMYMYIIYQYMYDYVQ